MNFRINIPSGLDFGSLELAFCPHTQRIDFDHDVLHIVCVASGISLESLDFNPGEPSHDVLQVIAAWYQHHRSCGGCAFDDAELLREALEKPPCMTATQALQPLTTGSPLQSLM